MNLLASRWRMLLVATLGAGALPGCEPFHGGSTTGALQVAEPEREAIAAVPLGDVAGAAVSTLANQLPNPYSGNPQAVGQGHELYIRMNCAGCHGYDGKGGMGPNLTDGYWRYGGVPVSLFKSIYEGRPQGTPAWNPALPPQEIWKIVAYLESLGGTYETGHYQAWVQGDRPGQNLGSGVDATLAPQDGASTAPKPSGPSATPPSIAPTNDAAAPPGVGK